MYQILPNFRGYYCYLSNLGFLQVFAPSEKIENINDQYWTLRAEEVCYFMLHNYIGVDWFIFLSYLSMAILPSLF